MFTFVHEGTMYVEFNSVTLFAVLYTRFLNWTKDVSKVTAQPTILESTLSNTLIRLTVALRKAHMCIICSVGVLRPVQQPGSYWDRSSELPLVGLEPTEVTAYD